MLQKLWFRLVLVITLFAVLTVGGIALAQSRKPHSSTGSRLRVAATFYPIAEFSRQVGGTAVEVHTLVKPGTEPHDYDPSPQDIAGIYNSRVLVYNGAGLERWVGKLQNSLAKNGVVSVNTSSGLHLRAKDPTDTENTSATDPHVWLDPALAMHQVTEIKAGLTAADPTHQALYERNANTYIAKLRELDTAFRSGLASCQLHDIVTSHQAFSYLAAQYGLHAIGIAGLSPDDEPSPAKLAQVADFAKNNNVRYIFFETLANPKLSQTIAQEIGAQTIVFNPLEGLTNAQVDDGQNYISVQQANLRALRTALDCK